ncbi:MAG: ATP synthase F1 subunit delta [Schwartzia sp.]|nr:ATP synthase F1 subunit delta [Schwartzia sp. (in: firmicutes)]
MLNLQLAHRYSKAFFLVARDAGKLEDYGNELKGLVKDLEAMPELQAYFGSPLVPVDAKKEMAAKCFDGEISNATMNFLRVLLDKQRESLLFEISREYEALANEAEGIIVADVTTARDMRGEQQEHLKRKLAELTGKKIKLRLHLDPKMIGGAIIQIGDRRIDGSLTRQLEELRSELLRH